jgi:hypothetical protein
MRSFRRKGSRTRRPALGCETLESRVVLTYAGPSSLLGSLSYVGVVTTPIESTTMPVLPINPVPMPMNTNGAFALSFVPSTTWTKLRTDLQTLETELQSLAAKSGVTIEDLQNLTNDSQAISQAGFYFQASTLNPVISELAVAVAGGTSTSQAQTDFSGLFGTSSSVSTTTITSTFNDLVKAITDSAVTTTDLSTVAADEAAIESDLPKIPSPMIPSGQAWLDQVGSTPVALSLAPAVTSPTAAFASPILPIGPPQPIIISPFGGLSLLGSLSSVGVVTSPVFLPPQIVVPMPVSVPPSISVSLPGMQGTINAVTVLPNIPAASSGAWQQLQTDVKTLQTELESLAEKSGLTIADEQSLTNDAQAIAQAGFHFTASTLNPVISELATAVAGGASTTQAQAGFTALFPSTSNVSSTTITNTFNDLVKAIQDSAVTTTDLSTVAADQAAIQTDLKNLFPGRNGGGSGSSSGGGSGSTGTGTVGSTGSGSTGSGSTGTGSTGTSGGQTTNGGHRHKVHHPAHLTVKVAKVTHTTKIAHATKVAHAATELSRSKKR